MIKVAANSVFDLEKLTVGSGTITPNAHSITLTSTANTDKAYIYRFIAARGGTRVTVRATARCLTEPEQNKEMKLGIDSYKQGLVEQISINSTAWQTYQISTVIPYDKTGLVNFKAVIGAWSNQIAQIEVAELDVFVENAGFAGIRAHAIGVIDLTGAAIRLNTQHIAIGIRDVMYQSGTLTIQTDGFAGVSAVSTSPIQMVQLQASVKCPVQAYISSFDRATGVVKVKFSDTQTGENVDITQAPYTDSGNKFYLHFTSLC